MVCPFLYKDMTALDIITVDQAKNWLSTEEDTDLPRLIASAVNWVEVYTGHYLFQRVVTVRTDGPTTLITQYPADIVSVLDGDLATVDYKTDYLARGIRIKHGCGNYTVTVLAGYASLGDVPSVLVDGAYKMLTYLYENRDMYPINLPQDIQFMVNKLRRNLV